MNIIHYTLGLSPQRSGGLTKYATDLMEAQSKTENVCLLFPSGYSLFSKKIKLKRHKSQHPFQIYTLSNSLPVPLLFGIKCPSDFINGRTMSEREMTKLYEAFKPDVFHVHTLMGLPRELLVFFKSKGVKLIFTTHDYFGICPKVNLIDNSGVLCSGPHANNCAKCNLTSKPTLFLRLRNSKLALNIKNVPILRKILK